MISIENRQNNGLKEAIMKAINVQPDKASVRLQ